MELKAYSIRDAKAETFHPPWYKPNAAEAERDFHKMVNDEKSMANQYPDDFDLYHIGSFNTDSGKFTPLDTPRHLIKAIQCLQSKQPSRFQETNV